MFYLYPSHLLIFPCHKVDRNIICAVSEISFPVVQILLSSKLRTGRYMCVRMYLCRTYLIEGWCTKGAEQMIITTKCFPWRSLLGFLFFLLLTSQSQVLFTLYLQDALDSWSRPETIGSEIRSRESSLGWKLSCFPQMSMHTVEESLLVKVAQRQLFQVRFWGCSYTHSDFQAVFPWNQNAMALHTWTLLLKLKASERKGEKAQPTKLKSFFPRLQSCHASIVN